MARKLFIEQAGTSLLLSEVAAASDLQLQEQLKKHPELLPVSEFGLSEPLMVVGRETILPSGSVDLVGLARSGDLLLIEFKTGPQNPDFRQALAQLLDYGSDVWRMTYEQFERAVVLRYFASNHCGDPQFKRCTSVADTALTAWPDLSEEERSSFREHLTRQLESGSFHYVVLAQRFLRPMEQTINYMNAASRGSRFYAVELVRFTTDGVSAFECRTIVKPTLAITVEHERIDIQRLLKQIQDDDPYRLALERFFSVVQELDLEISPGVKGLSIRLQTTDRPEPVSVGWIFPPGVSGWMGLSDVTLGFDPSQARHTPSVQEPLKRNTGTIGKLQGAVREVRGGLEAFHLSRPTVVARNAEIAEALAELVNSANDPQAADDSESSRIE